MTLGGPLEKLGEWRGWKNAPTEVVGCIFVAGREVRMEIPYEWTQ